MFTTDQRHLFFVSFYRFLDDSSVSPEAGESLPESPEGSDNKKPAGLLHPTKPPPVEPKVLFLSSSAAAPGEGRMFAYTAPNSNSPTKTDSAPAFAAHDAALLGGPTASPMFHQDNKRVESVSWGAGGRSARASTGTTTFAFGNTTVASGTSAAAFPPAAVAGRVANIGASNTARPAVFALPTGSVNFGASMSATAGGNDAPLANSLASGSRKRLQSDEDEETAYRPKRSRRN
jgi:hypothetical protein